jgi:hypothetical protein
MKYFDREFTEHYREAEDLYGKITDITGVDIFDNTRKVEYIEARALFNYILYNTHGYTLTRIARFYIKNGKHYDHATCLHSLKNFAVYEKFSKYLPSWMDKLGKVDEVGKNDLARFYLVNLNKGNTEVAYEYLKEMYEQQQVQQVH